MSNVNAILSRGTPRIQSIKKQGYDPSKGTLVTIFGNPVGLVLGYFVKVTGTLRTGGVGAATRSPHGAANLLRDITFTDVNNITRHKTKGWHLSMINSAKQPMVISAAYAPNNGVGYGSNYSVAYCPADAAINTDIPVQFIYYVPVAYNMSLVGAMFAGITGATATLELNINPNPIVDATDAGLAVFSGNQGGGWKANTNVTIEVLQHYIDGLPSDKNGPLLPLAEMSMLYQLQDTSLSGLAVGADLGIPYTNYRDYYSTCVMYNNGGVYNPGTDINTFALRTANSSRLWEYTPDIAAYFARGVFMADPPVGTYYFGSRERPISIRDFGNTELVVNPSVVNANAEIRVGFEFMSNASQVLSGSSLPSG